MSVSMDVGRLRLGVAGVATTYGLLDGSLDIAKGLLGLIKEETHLNGLFLECRAVPELFAVLGAVLQLALCGGVPSDFAPYLMFSRQCKYQNNMMLCKLGFKGDAMVSEEEIRRAVKA
jgi:hypothetical protein